MLHYTIFWVIEISSGIACLNDFIANPAVSGVKCREGGKEMPGDISTSYGKISGYPLIRLWQLAA